MLEYYSTFADSKKNIKEETIFRFSDMDGKTIALRPDNTSPMLRVATSKLKDEPLPLKLCYSQEVFRNTVAFHAKRSQMLQSGIEIIGGSCSEEDIRCIFTALECLNACNGQYKLEIGHAGFFDALISKYSLNESDKENLRNYIAAKNSGEYPFSTAFNNSMAVQLASVLQRLFGGVEVIEKAEALIEGNTEAKAILDYIKDTVQIFIDAGYGDRIIIDLGMVQKINYYTGLVFKGYVEGVGEAVLSGGRYDNLLSGFGSNLSACGFGLNISELSALCEVETKEAPPLSFKNGAKDIEIAKNYLYSV